MNRNNIIKNSFYWW